MVQTITSKRQLEERLKDLQRHLEKENPVLLQIVKSFRQLDRVAYRLGLLDENESYATRVPWWPLVSVLGLYSSGKSSFINHYLGEKLQLTGNQAVDDKFTVICYSGEATSRVLPGRSLDADPRFPFYQISADIEKVAEGEGRRIDAYLQLKTSASEKLRGKILIDSPGFDADAQRDATLRLTDHIVDLSDLVLVLFDARHPEPGAMRDTLEHLVTNTISRPDSTKFLYILNQIDTAAREDNPERVFAAWQRALSEKGLTAGRFYSVYNPEVAIPIEDEGLRRRFEQKRAQDMGEIYERMHQVEVERAYRIIGILEETAKNIEDNLIPQLHAAKKTWRRRVIRTDLIVFGVAALGLLGLSVYLGYWEGVRFNPPWLGLFEDRRYAAAALGVVVGIAAIIHHFIQKSFSPGIIRSLEADIKDQTTRETVINAFRKNIGFFRSFLSSKPSGWGRGARKRLAQVVSNAGGYVQALNDQFADPSGRDSAPASGSAVAASQD